MTFKQWLNFQEKYSIDKKEISNKMGRLQIGKTDKKGPEWASLTRVYTSKKE
jgi:hypothetical protein